MMQIAGEGAVLVTGATGFLGASLARTLVAEGVSVHALVRPGASLQRLSDVIGQLRLWEGDVTELGSLTACVRGSAPATIFHLAGDTGGRRFAGNWPVIERALAVNVQGTLNMLRAAELAGASLRTFVRAGGMAEYGSGPSPSHEGQREQPCSPYAASQTAATHWCQSLQPQLNFSVVTLRLALTYGPGQATDFFIPALIDALLHRTPFAATSGRQGRDLVYVDDIIAGLRAASFHSDRLRGAVINVSSGRNVPLYEVAAMIAELLDAAELFQPGAMQDREGEIEHMSGDTAEAERLLGWRATTALRDGLQRTIDARREHLAREERA